jgi:hypothetical protein
MLPGSAVKSNYPSHAVASPLGPGRARLPRRQGGALSGRTQAGPGRPERRFFDLTGLLLWEGLAPRPDRVPQNQREMLFTVMRAHE